jgi:hypothetical protein
MPAIIGLSRRVGPGDPILPADGAFWASNAGRAVVGVQGVRARRRRSRHSTSRGLRHRHPSVSVRMPGVTSSALAMRMIMPSINDAAGMWPSAVSRRTRPRTPLAPASERVWRRAIRSARSGEAYSWYRSGGRPRLAGSTPWREGDKEQNEPAHESSVEMFDAGARGRRIARLVSVATASRGNNVTPAPSATICASVGRLVARNSSSCAWAREQTASACSRKQ